MPYFLNSLQVLATLAEKLVDVGETAEARDFFRKNSGLTADPQMELNGTMPSDNPGKTMREMATSLAILNQAAGDTDAVLGSRIQKLSGEVSKLAFELIDNLKKDMVLAAK